MKKSNNQLGYQMTKRATTSERAGDKGTKGFWKAKEEFANGNKPNQKK